jgi:hypothetical protein
LFISKIEPETGLTFRNLSGESDQGLSDTPIRTMISLGVNDTSISAYVDGKVYKPEITDVSINFRDSDIACLPQRNGQWTIDLRQHPRRKIADVVEETLSLPDTVYHGIFSNLRSTYPEYEEGFRTITDTLHRFALLLFAQAITLQHIEEPSNLLLVHRH